ncbi:Plasmodesmata-located protein 2 [Camellia lanceoleosa]|uniref:Plasmodesmata-located protein 2 n=1 Tax=Camellia lanceoleosa TaxID=1840588 RepID=A0ACC0IRF9_9ERIC|nr:Plasmodesmata-located protein 2 [Camellia lanceoleosa]
MYTGCAKQQLSDPTGVYSSAISTLYVFLISQSSNAKFFKTTTGSGQTTITGLFQCRGDLSNVDCYNCVSQLPILIDKQCTGQPIAARIQLMGCYMLYEIAGFTQVSGMEMLYKTCSGQNKQGSGFEEKRDTALSALENGIGSSGNGGFYTTSYDSVYVWGQCEGDLGGADCGDCVRSAVQRSQVECGSSVSPHNHQMTTRSNASHAKNAATGGDALELP